MFCIIDNGHGENTLGKCSPDKSVREYAYARKLAKGIAARLNEEDIEFALLVPEEKDISITERIRRANAIYTKHKDALLISLHLNAGGNGKEWSKAKGWSVFVSKNASFKSKIVAQTFTAFAEERDLMGNRAVPECGYWTWSWTKYDIALLSQSYCPAVLTENLFQDNKEDVEFLLSEEGFNILVELHVEVIKDLKKNTKLWPEN